MNEADEPKVDLNKLRDDALAGRDIGPGPEPGSRPPHIINPAEHPEVDWSKDPDIHELRRIAREKQEHKTDSEDTVDSDPEVIDGSH